MPRLASFCAALEQETDVSLPPRSSSDDRGKSRRDTPKSPPDAIRVGQNAPSHAVQSSRDLNGRLAIEVIERTATLCIDIFRDLGHRRMAAITSPNW